MSDAMKDYPHLNSASTEVKLEVASLLSSLIHSLEYEGTPDKYLVGYREILSSITGEAKKQNPVYVHDCDACTYIETITVGLNVYDVYKQCTEKEEYVYRYSDEGPEYFSGTKESMQFCVEANKEVKL